MTIRTGKGGRYRYYTCNNRVNEGATTCPGRNIPMRVLDGLVLDALEARVFASERLEKLLASLLERVRNKTKDHAAKAMLGATWPRLARSGRPSSSPAPASAVGSSRCCGST